ncbi:hypothetical protein PMI04_009645 [Sphingobium sp. AP49]|uniref:hypothetical protein n=1 Tax=Sphingobium sp. AP49 TaxID=1144307 RepID=UPI00026EC826|nr:hypothetical protein [Sphingobium sp. AP49]WHO40823.1 hypothetical protein PMI04_009645 [Sphingobium sp. AP49]
MSTRPDDTLIRDFCRENRLSFLWRTRMDGNRARAHITVKRGEETLYDVGTNGINTEQGVLDILSAWAIKHITEPPKPDTISGWTHAKPKHREGD